MTSQLPSPPPRTRKEFYHWRKPALEEILQALIPHCDVSSKLITSIDLNSNASFVNYVKHHTVVDLSTNQTLELIEKSVRKIAFIGSQEARFHRAWGMLDDSTYFRHPECLGVIETPWESLIFTTFLRGKPPRMHAIARQLALGIAEQEKLSHKFIKSQPAIKKILLWSMDFYRPWFLLRPRFNFQRYLTNLEKLARDNPIFTDLSSRFRFFLPAICKMAKKANKSRKCISHMDYLRKNILLTRTQLQLFDWSEAKIGRFGFDGGAYLGSLFRRNEMPVFLAAQAEFIETYLPLHDECNAKQALINLRYIFLLTALYHTLRPETIEEYKQRKRMPLLLQKYEYLLSLLESDNQ